MPQLLPPSELTFAELCCHVLAHVRGTSSLPASLYSGRYVSWAERQLGPATARALAADAEQLSLLLPSHAALAEVQPLARLYTSISRVLPAEARALADLVGADVDSPSALAHVQRLGAPAELLWCALLLELPAFRSLQPVPAPPVELLRELDALVPLAPALQSAKIGCVRALHRRGRLWSDAIWVGHPGAEPAPSLVHAAWQAAHEATVGEVAERDPTLGERAVEVKAVTLLRERASAAGRSSEHDAWLVAVATSAD